MLLGTGGAAGVGAHELAERLLAQFGSLSDLARAPTAQLAGVRGIGPAKAATLSAAFALARRSAPATDGTRLSSSALIAEAARPWLVVRSRERTIVLSCDNRLRLLGVDVVGEGAADGAPLPVRETLGTVLRRDGVAFALAHNHPSGDATPSAADAERTDAIAAAAAAVGLRFLDHVILAGTTWRSLTAPR